MTSLGDRQQKSLNALLYDAVRNCNLERVELCLSRGAQAGPSDMSEYFSNRNEENLPLAHIALKNYDAPVLDALAQGGLDVDQKDADGYTALARATRRQRLDCVTHFLKIGADPLAETGGGRTVLDIARNTDGASSTTHEAIIDALLTAAPAKDFNAAATKDAALETSEPITVSRPISLTTPHKKEGFQL
jgi:ankyrin repeat protein